MARLLALVFALAIPFDAAAMVAREIKVGFGAPAPYVLRQEEHPGIAVEIIRETFKLSGIGIQPVYHSYQRSKEEVKRGRLDAASTAQRKEGDNLHFSVPCISFHPVAIVRKRAGLALEGISDLPGHSIAAWQNAHEHLGEEFGRLFGRHVTDAYVRKYFDPADQLAQVKMFWSGRAEIVIIDRLIFDYLTTRLGDHFDTAEEVEEFPIFGDATVMSVAFSDPELRDRFDRGYAELRRRGVIDGIYEKYRMGDID
ncbi:MAG: substrate-binding periplasmic protein [Geminicoccaceae bacterium]